MKRHMVFLVAVYCLGICTAACLRLNLSVLFACSASLFLLSFLLRNAPRLSCFCLVSHLFLFGSMAFLVQKQSSSLSLRSVVAYHPDALYTLAGCVVSEPLTVRGKTSFLLAAEKVSGQGEWAFCRDRVRVEYEHPPWFALGDKLMITGSLRLSSLPRIAVKARSSISSHGFAARYWLKRQASMLRCFLRQRSMEHIGGSCGALICGMLLGDKESIPRWIRHELARSGTAHILVISGFHVGFLGFLFMQAAKLAGMPRRLRIAATVSFLIFYCILTGASIPVVRATCMGILFLSGYLIKRECELLHLIALSALVILAFSPAELFGLRFQLSFLSVTAIAVIYPRVRAMIPAQFIKRPALRFIAESASVSFAAWVGTVGVIAHCFKIISPVAICANVIIIPLAALLITSGVIFMSVSSVCSHWGVPFAHSVRLFTSILLHVNSLLLKLPGAYWLIG